MKKIILLLFSFYASSLPAQVITVRQDGLGDYTTIQQGIDAAAENDTVLVYPGTYQENIDFSGKNITVCSLNLMTDDPAYIHQTVIDGNSLGSCVKLMSGETNALLHGFTLINGSGTYLGGGYYYCGGIRIQDSNAAVSNCIIKHNRVNGWGGGMACFNANVRLSNVTISNNHAFRGGGGIVISGTGSLVFDTIALCNIYLNYSSCACDIYKGFGYPPLHVVVDTFTVLTPDVHHLFSSLGYGYPSSISPGKSNMVKWKRSTMTFSSALMGITTTAASLRNNRSRISALPLQKSYPTARTPIPFTWPMEYIQPSQQTRNFL